MELGMRSFTVEQRESLRQWLEDRAAVLRSEIDGDLKENLDAEPELAAAIRDADELRDIESALERLRGPDFGRCSGCGADIAFIRLKTNPACQLCVECQEREERRQRIRKGVRY
jgi:RNA polymerase-binding transcription factor DksA